MAELLSIDAALAQVLARARPLPSERVPLEQAAGRVLAEDVAARVDLPPFASSAMDGFAVRAADLPKLRRSLTTRTFDSAACSLVIAANEPSVEPSST